MKNNHDLIKLIALLDKDIAECVEGHTPPINHNPMEIYDELITI